MGVRGLQSFLEQNCPCACPVVNVATLAKKYKNETGKDAVIVVDTQTLFWTLCKGMDWIIGYEIQEYLHRLRTLVESFQESGIKLVFFVSGVAAKASKKKKLFSRRAGNLHDTIDLCVFLEKKGVATKFIPEKYASLPPSVGFFTSMLLKHVFNCEVYMTINDYIQEIIEYVHKNDCMAIFTQDSDFIVSDINDCLVLSARNFDQEKMTTILYDRQALAMILEIAIEQLPIVAILAGCDCIDYEVLKDFHRSLCGVHPSWYWYKLSYKEVMTAIGRYINTLSDLPIDKVLESICVKVAGNTSLDSVKSAYYGYQLQKKPDNADEIKKTSTKWSEILGVALNRHKNMIAPACIWTILTDQFFELSVAFEDLRKVSTNRNQPSHSQFISSAAITRVLRQRLYGILMNESEHSVDVGVEEWCAENVYSYRQPIIVKPIASKVQYPGLLQLWSNEKSDELGETKWKLFLSIISPSITSIDDWCSLSPDLIGIAAALFYLIDQKFMNEDEVNAVLATIATFSLYSREALNELDYGLHHSRCTHISVCLIRTFTFVVTAMAACGYPVPLSGELIYLKLEAKLFQIKFRQMLEKKTIEELCENNDKCIEIFNRLKKVLSPLFRKPSIDEVDNKISEKPADVGNKPLEEEKPADVGNKPLEEEKPADDGDKQSKEEKPADDGDKQSKEENPAKPADDGNEKSEEDILSAKLVEILNVS
ncbi:constitutive coactivator of peroxisome proliferator-activated receptor gamma-like [Planococcus citri]|uniref:constitutive coactivator of peroxisome proliferator-activated receptor gamma-like n=1 Tax=Planococcus citri TaxID=170843 RepID=UPI0031F9DE69